MVRAEPRFDISVAEFETDPYPIYRALRAEAPVAWVDSVGLWLITRWDDVRHVALNHDDFTTAIDASPLVRTLGPNLMHAEDPYHASIRTATEAPFRPAAVRRERVPEISRIANTLIDAFQARGEADLIAAFAEPLSVRVLQLVLGVDELPEAQMRRWFNELATGGSNFEADPAKQATGDRASGEVDAAIAPLLERFERDPDGSVLARLHHAHVDGRRLTRAEVAANLKLMILGGMQEPRDLIGLALGGLFAEPAQAARAAADPSLDRALVEEALRWGSPVATLTRQTRRHVALAGVTLEPGARVAAVIASANRDERRWPDPDRFDLDRPGGTHLAFGLGGHFCLGAALARQEAAVGLRLLFDRLPNLRLDPARPAVIRGWEFRGPLHLHALWDA